MKGGVGRSATLEIRTPEGVVFSQALASPVTRFFAFGIDFAVITVLQVVVRQVLMATSLVAEDAALAIMIALYFALSVGYGMFFEWVWSGQTVGKRVVGLRVIDENGLNLKGTQIVIRNLMRFIDGLPALYFVGGLATLLSERSQRLGDLAAGTLVVRTPRTRQPRISEVLGSQFHNVFSEHPHLEARLRQRVVPEEAQLVMNALVRREDLEPDARVRFYGKLADYFREMVRFPEDALVGMTDEQYLRNVVDSVFRVRGGGAAR